MITPDRRFATVFTICLSVLTGCSSYYELEWNEQAGYRWAEIRTDFFGSAGFKRISSTGTNIQFRNDVSRDLLKENRHYLNGSGVAVADIDGDGLIDIYFARLEGPNKLYKNLGGYLFKDITDKAGVAHEGYHSTGVVFADIDGDADPDLLVTSLTEENVLYINDGQGIFELKEDSGLGKSNGAMTMTLADINGDGLLDLYIANYKRRGVKDLYSMEKLAVENTLESIDGEMRIIPPFDEHYSVIESQGKPIRVEDGAKDELYINKGSGIFKLADPSRYFFDQNGNEQGLARDWGLTATFRDVTGDMLPDLYVANDFWTPDRFWINRGDGTFKAADTNAVRSLSFSSMGVDFSDINRDGFVDFVVTEMLSQEHTRRMRQVSQSLENGGGRTLNNRNSVYLNRGDNTYAQIAHYSGLQASGWSWATRFMDVDLDGYEDLIVATGYAYDYLDMDTQFFLNKRYARGLLKEGSDIFEYPSLELSNKIFRNNGDLTFTDVSSEWGFKTEDISMGMALADLNNDGDLDLVINRFNDEAAIYENTADAPRIAVRLKGEYPNTQGIGAKIELKGGSVIQSKEVASGGSYLSGSQPQVVFAAHKQDGNYTITVNWPGGKVSRISGVYPNRIYEINEASSTEYADVSMQSQKVVTPVFEDVSGRLNHRHHENEFDDSAFQPLLPQKLSRQGPGVAWIDYNMDGMDDLLIASGKGGEPGLFENTGDGDFNSVQLDKLTTEANGDQTAIISWREGEYLYIIIGSANYEQGNSKVPSACLYLIDPNGSVQQVNIPGALSSTGPLAAADIDGNGYMDIFIGGRFKPGQYPQDAGSGIFMSKDGSFKLDTFNLHTFSSIGLVTGAVFSDFNQDGQPDLLISTEWGSFRLFENKNGFLNEITSKAGLDKYKGWWRGVATGDFNNDGLPDIAASNIGLNSPYRVRNGHPLRLYYGDLNLDGRLDIVNAYYADEVGAYAPRRRLHNFGSIPTVLNQVKTHREFARSSIDKIFGINFSNYSYKEINTLEHMVFINTGNGFTAHPLPPEAQFTAGSYIGVADFDNDGYEDLFLSQNYFAFPAFIPRLDAGRGLVLKGDGEGNFIPVPGTESGIKIYGDQRGAALSDFNRDGKVDLVVSQNDGKTKLYLNRTDKSGISVRLIGPENNTDAIGSGIRIVYKDGSKGPLREIQAGSGYWSQNSKVQILGTIGIPIEIEVIWFDGRVVTVPIQEGKMTYKISY